MSANRTYLDYLIDIVSAMDDIALFVSGYDENRFHTDRKTVYAVIRALEIMGEASKRIPGEVQARHPQVPWRFIARMRDRIIHGYDTVDTSIIWQTIHTDLLMTRPLVAAALEAEQMRDDERNPR